MILNQLAAYAEKRVQLDKEKISLADVKQLALNMERGKFSFEYTLAQPGISIIAEVKKASPSKGIISEIFPYVEIAKDYEKSNADCISVLTEPKWFLGSDEIFREIRKHITIPMLRKDFTVDEYQIYQAKTMGADAVLLICAITPTDKLQKYLEICDTLGISALVETHDQKEIQSAICAGAKIIGVNNRNLKDFSVDLNNAQKLREYIPDNVIYVAESGICCVEDGVNIAKTGVDALLIGEHLMKCSNRHKMIAEIKG